MKYAVLLQRDPADRYIEAELVNASTPEEAATKFDKPSLTNGDRLHVFPLKESVTFEAEVTHSVELLKRGDRG